MGLVQWLLACLLAAVAAQSPCSFTNSSTSDWTVVAPCVLAPGFYVLRNLYVNTTLSITATSSCAHAVLNIAGTTTITTYGSIVAVQTSSAGVGVGNSDSNTGSGGSFGGVGGASITQAPPGAYSTMWFNASQAVLCGSAGGAGTLPGGLGGGVVEIYSSNPTFIVDGSILANGGDAQGFGGGGGAFLLLLLLNVHSAGGSGGSIRISAPSITGAGFIQANGG